MHRISFILFFLCTITSHGRAQGVVDEHFQQQLLQKKRQQIQSDLERRIDELMNLIQTLYHADECGVFKERPGNIFNFQQIWYPDYLQLSREGAVMVPNFGKRVVQAQQQGRTIAHSVGGCDYWRSHQELIAELREQARIPR